MVRQVERLRRRGLMVWHQEAGFLIVTDRAPRRAVFNVVCGLLLCFVTSLGVVWTLVGGWWLGLPLVIVCMLMVTSLLRRNTSALTTCFDRSEGLLTQVREDMFRTTEYVVALSEVEAIEAAPRAFGRTVVLAKHRMGSPLTLSRRPFSPFRRQRAQELAEQVRGFLASAPPEAPRT